MRRALVAAVLVLASSCRAADANAPRQMTLSFEPARITTTGQRLSDERMSCEIEAVIRAHGGSPSDSLQLLQIVSTFFDARGVRVNSTSAIPSDWFGTNRLGYDQRSVAHRTANGPVPINVKIALSYLDLGGSFRSDTLTVACQ